jgi:hypothetical protein
MHALSRSESAEMAHATIIARSVPRGITPMWNRRISTARFSWQTLALDQSNLDIMFNGPPASGGLACALGGVLLVRPQWR